MEYKVCTLSPTHNYFSQACTLYIEAFPKEERRELEEWRNLFIEEPNFRGLAITLEGEFAGFITYWKIENFFYIEHLAIMKHQRSRGLGRLLIGSLLEKAKNTDCPIILEAEHPISPNAVRRLHFYEQLGIYPIDYAYLQPPYRSTDVSFPLLLLTQQPNVVSQHAEEYVNAIYRKVYKYPS